MKIIDRKSGKRIEDNSTRDNAIHGKKDPVKRNVEKGLENEEHSPMNPPDAYDPDYMAGKIKYEEMPDLLKILMDEHREALSKIDEFEKALSQFRDYGYRFDKKINETFGSFFDYLDNHLIPHNIKEEKTLFPLLHQRLVESGEHSPSSNPTTAIDLMEDDHIKFIQLGTLTFNLLGLATRLQDERSRMVVFDIAYNNGRELVEILKLHIYREDNTLFPLAHNLISGDEFFALEGKL